MAAANHTPQHLASLADILGPDVPVSTLEKLHALSKGDLNAALDAFYDGSYLTVAIPPPTPQPVQANTSVRQPLKKPPPSLSSHFSSSLNTHSSAADRNGGNSSLMNTKTTTSKRKIQESFFPKFLGELTVTAYALGGMVKVQAGEEICFERTRPNPQLQLGRKKKGASSTSSNTGWNGRALKENNVVRFTKLSGFEIGRLPVDVARWVSKLMDYGLAEFRGRIIYCPSVLSTGTEIYLTMRCYLTAAAFSTLGADTKQGIKSKAGTTMVNESNETDEELDLKYRKYAVNALFKELDLKPIETNSLVGPRDHGIEIFSSSPETSSAAIGADGEEKEEEPEVSDKELDVLYEKAQQHGREFEPMDPPATMTYTLKPYQRQALAWMYHKECPDLGSNGNKPEHQTLHPLWEAYEFKQEDGFEIRSDEPRRYYLNPYSSEMSLEFPTSDQLCRGGILADEMGLGKTIEVLSLVHANPMDRSTLFTPEEAFARLSTSTTFPSSSNPLPERKRCSPTTLVVCPMSLLSQWRDEAINSSDGKLQVEVYYGGTRYWNDQNLQQKGAPDVLITSYGTVLSQYAGLVGEEGDGKGGSGSSKNVANLEDIKKQNDWKKGSALFNVDFHRVVLDEAHQIKSRLTKTAQACYAISSARRWVVTGTPIQNKLEDLFSLVHFLRAEPWSNFSFWRTFISIPFESKDKDKAMKVITSVLEPLVLRRTKLTKDERGDPIVMLPEKVIEIEYLKFSEEENDIYQALFKDGKTKFNHYCRAGTVLRHYASIFQLLMRMRQVCDHPVLVVGRSKPAAGVDSIEGSLDLKDGPIQLEALMAKFSGSGDSTSSFGATVLQNLISDTGETPECPVCFEDMADGVLMPCMHSACRSCVLDYLQVLDNKGEKGECPICRQGPITDADLIEYSTTEDPVSSDPTQRSEFTKGNVLDFGGTDSFDSSPALVAGGGGGGGKRIVRIRRNNFKSSAKLDALMRHLNLIRKTEPRTKSVIFSQFTGMLDLTEAILERDGFEFLRLDGTHSQSSREKTLEAFKDPEHGARVILISLRAGGVGLNLTAASRVFMLDPWWNYAIEAQAIDRVHRIGQTKPVKVKRFIIQDSVEEKILAIQNRKNALASGLGMTKSEAQGARLEDLQQIFS